MSSRHSHGSESSRGPSREPSRLSTTKNQPVPVTPEPKEKLEENENEEAYADGVEEEKEKDIESDGGEVDKVSIGAEPSVKDETFEEEEAGVKQETEEDEGQGGTKDQSDGGSETQEDGYDAEAEGDDQPEALGSPPPDVQEQSAEDFESKTFLNNLSELSEKLQSERYQTLNEEFPLDELKSMVTAVVRTMDNFRDYSKHCQQQMEGIREHMKVMREKIHKRIAARPYDPNTSK